MTCPWRCEPRPSVPCMRRVPAAWYRVSAGFQGRERPGRWRGTHLLAGTPGQRALEPHQRAADLVADAGVALLVVHDAAAAEDVAAAGARGGGGVGVDHFGGLGLELVGLG